MKIGWRTDVVLSGVRLAHAYKIELTLMLLDVDDADELEAIVCSSRWVFLCNFK